MTLSLRAAVPADAADIAAVHVSAWRETYPGIVPEAYLARLSYENRTAFWQRLLDDPPYRTNVLLAQQDGVVVGFGMCGPERAGLADFQGEFLAVYLLRRARRQGLGRRLMAAMAAALMCQGMVSASVWVLRDNAAARRFYEALGGRPVSRRPLDFDGTEVMEVCYGWHDLRPLAGGHGGR